MGVIRDNVFSKDTYGDRTERLIAIQGNFASVQSELNSPSNVVEWSVDCETVLGRVLCFRSTGASTAKNKIPKSSVDHISYQISPSLTKLK